MMKNLDSHQRNEDKEVEIMDFNQKSSNRRKREIKQSQKQKKKKPQKKKHR